uniref:Uncharacterized protein n=1 Tax=Chromera velia CCMP2878 TaxID=1169474 RepID=A0A0G4I485_9ALVE|eukprot:Cvel_10861.t1-p1 / transcript=Cvel_10861.t1 / gene=Cvel_10861 / organism=Chromera_velia_CCMP2878 / gene_product=hypothetical protein / transcript_product=hypothetical protein / location=Cvel_scaffold665:47202-48623(+) / protein_length=286 / sequence_SO=supercontig / SO=protein_coding / is_pseudo=false
MFRSVSEVVIASVELIFILELDDQIVGTRLSILYPKTLNLQDCKVPKALLDFPYIQSYEVSEKERNVRIHNEVENVTTTVLKVFLPYALMLTMPAVVLGLLGCRSFDVRFIDFDRQDPNAFPFHNHLPMGAMLYFLAVGFVGNSVAAPYVMARKLSQTASSSDDDLITLYSVLFALLPVCASIAVLVLILGIFATNVTWVIWAAAVATFFSIIQASVTLYGFVEAVIHFLSRRQGRAGLAYRFSTMAFFAPLLVICVCSIIVMVWMTAGTGQAPKKILASPFAFSI